MEGRNVTNAGPEALVSGLLSSSLGDIIGAPCASNFELAQEEKEKKWKEIDEQPERKKRQMRKKRRKGKDCQYATREEDGAERKAHILHLHRRKELRRNERKRVKGNLP
jgi:hypothetical protein